MLRTFVCVFCLIKWILPSAGLELTDPGTFWTGLVHLVMSSDLWCLTGTIRFLKQIAIVWACYSRRKYIRMCLFGNTAFIRVVFSMQCQTISADQMTNAPRYDAILTIALFLEANSRAIQHDHYYCLCQFIINICDSVISSVTYLKCVLYKIEPLCICISNYLALLCMSGRIRA